MKKKLIVLFTASFPYPRGEQFIESEIGYWSGLPWAEVVLCPYASAGRARPVPNDIEVVPSARARLIQHLWFAARALIAPLFWRELKYLWSANRLAPATCYSALRSAATTLYAKVKASSLVKQYGHIDVAYCYWNGEQAYAACLLKREGSIGRVISRAHGTDLYEDRRRYAYMPLKRQFVQDFDAIFSVSEDGKRYLESTYRFPLAALRLSRLGVAIPQQRAASSTDGVIRIASVSFCVRVKRIDKIIDAIEAACQSDPCLKIAWTHIGDGPLRSKLERLAATRLGYLSNATFEFAGAISNASVLEHHLSNPVDIFINCSESEGVPVSIMESMACGIPAIAPAVGGIPELIDNECGALVPEGAPREAVVAGVRKLTGRNREGYRTAARKRVAHNYRADANFHDFIAEVRKISEIRDTHGEASRC